jgi:hypothetical protein
MPEGNKALRCERGGHQDEMNKEEFYHVNMTLEETRRTENMTLKVTF